MADTSVTSVIKKLRKTAFKFHNLEVHEGSAIIKSRYIKTKVQKPSKKESMRVLNTNAITALSQNGRNQTVLFIVHHTLYEYDQSED